MPFPFPELHKIQNELLTAMLASVPDVLGDDGDHPGSLGRQVSSARLVVASGGYSDADTASTGLRPQLRRPTSHPPTRVLEKGITYIVCTIMFKL